MVEIIIIVVVVKTTGLFGRNKIKSLSIILKK